MHPDQRVEPQFLGPAEDCTVLMMERDEALRHVSELRDQIVAMDQAARLILRAVASPDSNGADTDEPSTLSTRCADERREDESSLRRNSTAEDVGKTFDDMHKLWKLEDTGFPSLFNACEMLRASRHLLAQEAEHALDEMRLAQEATAESERKLRKSKKALRMICRENRELKGENAKLRDTIRDMGHEQSKQLDEVYAILAHEEVLSPSRSRSFESSETSSPSTSPMSPCASKSFDDDESLPLFPRLDDENDSPLSMSPPRLVKRSATVHFEEEAPGVGDLIGRWMNRKDQQRGAYKITFPNSKEIGLKLHSMPIKPPPPDGGKGLSSSDKVPRVPLVGLQVDVNKLLRRRPDAFVVWGFRDVDAACSDGRPAVGARLVAVDGCPCEHGQWGTLNELCRKVRTKRGAITLTFRNDPVTKDQIDHLNRTLTPRAKGESTTEESGPTTVCLLKTPERRRPFGVLSPAG